VLIFVYILDPGMTGILFVICIGISGPGSVYLTCFLSAAQLEDVGLGADTGIAKLSN